MFLVYYLFNILLLNVSRFSIAFPKPLATQYRGSSARCTGTPVKELIYLSKFFNNADPPLKTIPLSIISDANSGGVLSSTFLTELAIVKRAGLGKGLSAEQKKQEEQLLGDLAWAESYIGKEVWDVADTEHEH